jgi:predicted TIM-barrel fold metal-dependent hydrolase
VSYDQQRQTQEIEPVRHPEQPIIDAHMHLYDAFAYGLAELEGDLASGHLIRGTVHIEVRKADYRSDLPGHLSPVGETEAVMRLARSADGDGEPRVCAGIIGYADLTDTTERVEELLEAHISAGRGRFRGVRTDVFADFPPPRHLLAHRQGWREVIERQTFIDTTECLARRGLSLDLVCATDQLAGVARMAARTDATVVVNHLAPPCVEGTTAADWQAAFRPLAPLPNVHLKLGGCLNSVLGHRLPGFASLIADDRVVTSHAVAAAYRPYVEMAVEVLGTHRCMFESNFPVDRAFISCRDLWNAYKQLAFMYSPHERDALLRGNADRVYALGYGGRGLQGGAMT